jgi:hypothetical protein
MSRICFTLDGFFRVLGTGAWFYCFVTIVLLPVVAVVVLPVRSIVLITTAGVGGSARFLAYAASQRQSESSAEHYC